MGQLETSVIRTRITMKGILLSLMLVCASAVELEDIAKVSTGSEVNGRKPKLFFVSSLHRDHHSDQYLLLHYPGQRPHPRHHLYFHRHLLHLDCVRGERLLHPVRSFFLLSTAH